jgi:peroxiredoxin
MERTTPVATPAAPIFPTGPAIGELFPDFTLPDQSGTPVTFSIARGGKRAMIVVHRSAAW